MECVNDGILCIVSCDIYRVYSNDVFLYLKFRFSVCHAVIIIRCDCLIHWPAVILTLASIITYSLVRNTSHINRIAIVYQSTGF